MRRRAELLQLLLSHGLHESEARVYLTLLDHPAMPAAALAKQADVPRGHLYKVLHDLAEHGLVDILVDGRSRAYRARPFADFLGQKAEALRVRLRELEKQLHEMGPALQPPPLAAPPAREAAELRLVLGRRGVAREIDAMLATARHRVVASGSDGGWPRIMRHLRLWSDAAPVDARDCMSVEVLLPPVARGRLEWSDDALQVGATLRWFRERRRMLAVVVDDERILLAHPEPDTPDMRTGQDFAILARHPGLAQEYAALLHEAAVDADAPVASSARADPTTRVGERSS